MSINAINGMQNVSAADRHSTVNNTAESNDKSFADVMKTAIDQLNKTQVASDNSTMALASGNIDDLHNVMITAQKASITLQTAVQIQKKAVDAYNEVMRMQV